MVARRGQKVRAVALRAARKDARLVRKQVKQAKRMVRDSARVSRIAKRAAKKAKKVLRGFLCWTEISTGPRRTREPSDVRVETPLATLVVASAPSARCVPIQLALV